MRKLRLTGGEPLVRKNIMSLISNLGRHLPIPRAGRVDADDQWQPARQTRARADAGVRRINVSLDTLDADKFRTVTRWGDFDQVMRGLDAADRAGLKVKINAVGLRGFNDDEIHDMVAWCGDHGYDLTFIEVMPMGDIGGENRLMQYWPLSLEERNLTLDLNWPNYSRWPGSIRAGCGDRRSRRLHADDP